MEEGTDGLRKEAPQWSLNGDKKLLDLLESMHQKLVERCRETNMRLDEMTAALDDASIHLQNVNNKFTALSNSQFIESRVYDDDFTDIAEPEKPKEQPQKPPDTDLATIERSLDVLERMHEAASIVCDSDSDSGSDGDGDSTRVVVRPKDLYASRPLPYIIGSRQWKDKWHAGLIREESDSESGGEPTAAREQFSDSEPEAETPRARSPTISSSSVDSRVSKQRPATQADIAAALARSLGGSAVKTTPPREAVSPEPEKIVRKVYRPHQPAPGTIFSDEPPPLETDQSDESDQDIFAEIYRNQPNSKDDKDRIGAADDIFGTPVFDEVPPPPIIINKPTPPREERNETSAQKVEQENIVSKKPVGGKSIFGSNANSESIGAAILKRKSRRSSSDDSDEEPDSNNKSANKVANSDNTQQNNVKITEDETSDAKSSKERDIFDELFARSERVNKNLNQTKTALKPESPKMSEKVAKKVDLFSDNIFDDIDDIFTTNVTKTSNKKDTVKNSEKVHSKSIFDDDDDDLFSGIANNNKKTENINVFHNKEAKQSIFDSDDELFNDKPKVETTTTTKKNITEDKRSTKVANKGSIFESDDDIFTKPTTVLEKQVPSVAAKVSSKQGSLFDSDDDLFSEKPMVKPELKKLDKDKISDTNMKDSTYSNTLFESNTDNDIFSDVSRSKTLDLDAVLSDDTKTITAKTPQSESKLQTDSILQNKIFEKSPDIFSDEFDDDLSPRNVFDREAENVSAKKTQTPEKSLKVKDESIIGGESSINKSKHLTNVNIFDDEFEDDLFGKTTKPESISIKDDKDSKNRERGNFVETIESPTPRVNTVNVSENVSENETETSALSKTTIIDTEITVLQNVPDAKVLVNDNRVAKPEIAQKPTKVQVVNIHTEISQPIDDTSSFELTKETDVKEDLVPELCNKDSNTDAFVEPPKLKSDIFSDIFQDQPPDFEKPKEHKRSKNVNALFDDDSDDESLFFKKNDVTTDEVPEGFNETDERLFGLFRDEPPAIDVDFVQKSNKKVKLVTNDTEQFLSKDKATLKEQNVVKSDLFGDDGEDSIFATKSNLNANKPVIDGIFSSFKDDFLEKSSDMEESFNNDITTAKEDLRTSHVKSNIDYYLKNPKEVAPNVSSSDATDNPHRESKKIGKLKPMNLNINVNALVPGASPKKALKKEKPKNDDISTSTEETPSADDIEPSKKQNDEVDVPQKVDSKLVRSVSFEDKPDSNVLDNKLSKERAKIQVKRRPSTRKARREAVKKSGIDFGEDSTDNNSSSIDDIKPKEIPNEEQTKLVDTVHNSIKTEEDIFDKKYNNNIKDLVPSNENEVLLSKDDNKNGADEFTIHSGTSEDNFKILTTKDVVNTGMGSDSLNKPEYILSSTQTSNDPLDHILNDEKPKHIKDSLFNKLIEESPVLKPSPEKEIKSKVVYILNDEDIFNTKPEQNVEKSKAKSIFDDDNEDDIFKTMGVGNDKSQNDKKTSNEKVIQEKNENIFKSDEKLFTNTKSHKRSNTSLNDKLLLESDDESLFKTSAKTKIASNTVAETSKTKTNLFDSDEELFKKSKKVESVKKSSLFESDSDEDLFGGNKRGKKQKDLERVTEKKSVVRDNFVKKGSLFGDQSDEDDLFGAKKKIEPKQHSEPQRAMSKERDTKPVTVDPLSLFGSDDE